MCGIVGYIGDRQAQSILLGCLEKLEYRGYDSCGVAIAFDGIDIYKDAIRVKALGDLQVELGRFLLRSDDGVKHLRVNVVILRPLHPIEPV